MALFGPRKRKPLRPATLRYAPAPSRRLGDRLWNRQWLLHALVAVVGLVALLLAVQAWRAPFPFRLGDYIEHGVAARIDFQRINHERTDQARHHRASRVPYIFRHDPGALRSLPAQLRADLAEIAEAGSIDDVSPETRAAFGFSRRDRASARERPDQEFATLKSAVSHRGGSAGDRLDKLVDRFRQFIQPLDKTGLADPDMLTRNQIHPRDTVRIVPHSDTSAPTERDEGDSRISSAEGVDVVAADILLSEVIKETGRLGKSWSDYPELAAIRPMLEHWLAEQEPWSLNYARQATQLAIQQAREQVSPVSETYRAGEILVPAGETITDQHLALLRAEYNAVEDRIPWHQRLLRVVTVSALILVLAVLNGYYLVHNERGLVRSPSRLAVYLTALVTAVLAARLLSFDPWRAEVIPLVATVMVFAIAYNQELAVLTACTLALIIALSTTADFTEFVILLGVSATAIIPLSRVQSRSKLIKVGFVTGVIYLLISWGSILIERQSLQELWTESDFLQRGLWGGAYCIVAGYLVAGSLPFIESAFGVVTDISLLELGDVSHPLLQKLVHRAPGTYNHSISVATIGETAADRIGANGLLVRVGAYFHDVGKMIKPQYFVENMTEGTESRHEHLVPAMSTLIIIGHVKDGVDLARQHSLPQPIIDFIEQHHGTTLVAYFYEAAARRADREPDRRRDVQEDSFRYPGPKPQTREAGVMMLADAVESASRTLNDPTPKRIERLVHEITMQRLLDGQFDGCPLTLNEIHAVEGSLIKSLIAIYHGRIKYPAQRTA